MEPSERAGPGRGRASRREVVRGRLSSVPGRLIQTLSGPRDLQTLARARRPRLQAALGKLATLPPGPAIGARAAPLAD